jgi:hypothetical protein
MSKPPRKRQTFLVESWMEQLRQHKRVTKVDRVMQDGPIQSGRRAESHRFVAAAET